MTYHLPIEYAVFLDEFKRVATTNKNNIWIMKPTAKSQGKGIFLFNKTSAIQDWAENPDVHPSQFRQKTIFVKSTSTTPC